MNSILSRILPGPITSTRYISMAVVSTLALQLSLGVHSTHFESTSTLSGEEHAAKDSSTSSDTNQSTHSSQHIWSMLCSTYGGLGQARAARPANLQLPEKRSHNEHKAVRTQPIYSYIFAKRSSSAEPALSSGQIRAEPAEPSQRPKRNTLANYPWDLTK